MALDRKGETLTLQGGGEQLIHIACWSFFSLMALGIAVGTRDLAFGIVMLGACGWLLIRAVRMRVQAELNQLEMRGPFRTRRLSWSEVQAAEVGWANPSIPRWLVPIVHTTDGKLLKGNGVGHHRDGSGDPRFPIAEMVTEINRRARGVGRPERASKDQGMGSALVVGAGSTVLAVNYGTPRSGGVMGPVL